MVLAGLRLDRGACDVCRESEISKPVVLSVAETAAPGGKAEAGKKLVVLDRAWGPDTCELDIAGKALRGLGVNKWSPASRALIAKGDRLARS